MTSVSLFFNNSPLTLLKQACSISHILARISFLTKSLLGFALLVPESAMAEVLYRPLGASSCGSQVSLPFYGFAK